MFIIRDREAGNYITDCETYTEAIETVKAFEAEDKAENNYSEDFYEIVPDIDDLFEAMRNDICCMAEYGDSETDLLQELENSDNEILIEYSEIYLK